MLLVIFVTRHIHKVKGLVSYCDHCIHCSRTIAYTMLLLTRKILVKNSLRNLPEILCILAYLCSNDVVTKLIHLQYITNAQNCSRSMFVRGQIAERPRYQISKEIMIGANFGRGTSWGT